MRGAGRWTGGTREMRRVQGVEGARREGCEANCGRASSEACGWAGWPVDNRPLLDVCALINIGIDCILACHYAPWVKDGVILIYIGGFIVSAAQLRDVRRPAPGEQLDP